MICGQSWGHPDTGWTWCVLQRGHTSPCLDYAGQTRPAGVLTYDEQPEAAAAIEKAIADERRMIERKAAKKAA